MGKINSRSKGCRGERQFAAVLRKFGHEARRGQQFSGGNDSPDVVSSLPFHFEVKRTEALSIYKAMDQAVRDAEPSKVPVVAHKRNGREWLVIVSLTDFMKIVGKDQKAPCSIRRLRRLG